MKREIGLIKYYMPSDVNSIGGMMETQITFVGQIATKEDTWSGAVKEFIG